METSFFSGSQQPTDVLSRHHKKEGVTFDIS
jgi:hypothetical protein